MFNVSVKGNVRCNGLIPSGTGGMAKRGIHANHSTMPPNRERAREHHRDRDRDRDRDRTISDTRLKFSDRLKAYLSSDGLRSDAGAELDDPYTFSDSEVKVSPLARKCLDSVRAKVNHHATNHVDAGVKSETGKTMSRLQAQIARNKVTVKHNRNSPDLKIEKNHYDKSTKHSIIGLVNSIDNPPSRSNQHHVVSGGRRLPSGKPMPAHLRARRSSAKVATHHEGSLQRIPAVGGAGAAATVAATTAPGASGRWHAPQPLGPFVGAGVTGLSAETSLGVDSEDEDDVAVYQRHWFSKELELLSTEEGPREARLELTRTELKRQLMQMKRSKVGQLRASHSSSSPAATPAAAAGNFVTQVMRSLVASRRRRQSALKPVAAAVVPGGSPHKPANGLMVARTCEHETCRRNALPCTKHCVMHVMDNSDQVLFDHCTAKFADNTQCSVPVFDITHELPLCIEHARKRDNYNRMCLETKPKKPRRKIKPSAMIRPQKRSKKRKRSQKSPDLPHTQTLSVSNSSDVTELNVCETSSAYESSEEINLGTLSESEFVTIKGEEHIGDQDVVEQVLAMQDEVGGDLELVVEQTLVTQASRLLEETDFTNVLNQIPADEFNDLFAVDRNGEYEPSREETEELERALEAVDEDVKSLEKLSQTQGLLDSLLDEHTLVESLVQIPDVFHNGYGVQCVDSPSPHQSSPRPLPPFHHPVIHGVDSMMSVQPQAHTPS